MRKWMIGGLGVTSLASLLAGCGGPEGTTATEEQQKDPAWVQAQLREMDKGLTPDKPIPVPKKAPAR